MQPRRIARELALLSASQMPTTPQRLSQQALQSFVLAAVRTLTSEVKDTLETAAAEIKRTNEKLNKSRVFAADIKSAQALLNESVELAQTAINRLGTAVDLPELVQLSQQREVHDYALTLVQALSEHGTEIEEILDASLVDWQLNRIAQIDRNILKIAVAEIRVLNVPERIAINEAVELAKRYSTEEGHKFVNGVLRRVIHQLAGTSPKAANP
ncbi:MAG TPA: transcription antitermination factor NusB [Stenomitos sp.]